MTTSDDMGLKVAYCNRPKDECVGCSLRPRCTFAPEPLINCRPWSEECLECHLAYSCNLPEYTGDIKQYVPEEQPTRPIQTFESGATRDSDDDKLDYEGFLSPLVLQRFAAYMHQHRIMSDGSLRDSDNWQKGIPCDKYMKSMWRHFIDAWWYHRCPLAIHADPADMEEFLCALLFNVMGYLHELCKERLYGEYR